MKDPEKHRIYVNDWNREKRHRLRIEIVEVLGGKCNKCGFTDIRALQVDHVEGGGCKERRELSKGRKSVTNSRILLLIKESPSKYQLLCANCNWIKRVELSEYKK